MTSHDIRKTWILFGDPTMRIWAPCFCTMANSVAALAGEMRTQPCEAGRPRLPTEVVPWIAYWP